MAPSRPTVQATAHASTAEAAPRAATASQPISRAAHGKTTHATVSCTPATPAAGTAAGGLLSPQGIFGLVTPLMVVVYTLMVAAPHWHVVGGWDGWGQQEVLGTVESMA